MKKSISYEPIKEHYFHCELFEFNKGSKPSQVLKNITIVYPMISLSERTIRRWFSNFKEGEFSYKKKLKNPKKKNMI